MNGLAFCLHQTLMHVLSLRIVRPARFACDVARLVVNGRDLVDLVGTFERGFDAEVAGGYQALPAEEVLPPSQLLLGGPHPLYHYPEGRVALLACECGEIDCWPLIARIDVEEDRVIWHHFAQPHRPQWSYANFGPFVFDRAAYEATLRSHSSASRPVRQN